MKAEVTQCLQMLDDVYQVFGLRYTAALSTRPEKSMGDLALWDKAEAALKEALDQHKEKSGQAWEVSPGTLSIYFECKYMSI